MAEGISRIEKYATEGKQAFETNELIQVWVVHHLQILGEAARGVSEESQKNIPIFRGARSSVSGIFSSIIILQSILWKSGRSLWLISLR